MIKHIGKHNNKKVIIVYREVPEEEHMCLVIYSESLPSRVHDEVMVTLESTMGQDAKELADALFRRTTADGENCLTAIHKAGYMKKVPTNQVIVTPTTSSSCRLDELNTILKQMEQGEDAVKRLADLDNRQSQGIDGGRDLGNPNVLPTVELNTSNDAALSDSDLAKQRNAQAVELRTQAQGLIAEAVRLEQEAKAFAPKKKTNVTKSTTKKVAA